MSTNNNNFGLAAGGEKVKALHSDFIQQVKEEANIVDVISDYVTLSKAGREYRGLCPFHDERTPSFNVSLDKNLAHCFGCGWGGNGTKFVMEINKVSFVDAVLDIARKSNIRIQYADGSTEYDFPAALPKLERKQQTIEASSQPEPEYDPTKSEGQVNESVLRLLNYTGDAEKASLWLAKRGITPELIQHYRIGFEKRLVTPDKSKPDQKESYWSIAIFIPVPDRPGRFYVKKRVAPWLVGDERPDYLGKWSQFGVPATILFTYKPEDAKETWFCEGEWDAMVLGELARSRGEKVAVACSTSGCGTVPKNEQLDQLVGKVKILYDHDEAGRKGAEKLAKALGDRGKVCSVPIPDNCEIKGWDVSDALAYGYEWEDFLYQLDRGSIEQEYPHELKGNIKTELQRKEENAPNCAEATNSQPNQVPISLVDRFKADILKLTNSDDDVERLLHVNELASTYRLPAAEIRRAIAKTESATRKPKAQFFYLDDFLSMESEGIDYIIPGLLPRGETVLCAGMPKVGKSLLAIDAAFAIVTGESKFLGETVEQGKVLLISVDESAKSSKKKLLDRGFRKNDGKNLAVMNQWDVSQMGELEKKLEDFRPDVVIIDSLKRITAGREISENSAEFADIIYQIKELLGRYNAAGILIHHANKSLDAVGIAKVRGSTAISGAVWGIWQLEQPLEGDEEEHNKPSPKKPKFNPSNPRRFFTATCRDAESQLLQLQFQPENRSFVIANEDVAEQQKRKTQEQQVLELLEEFHPKGLTGKEIMAQLTLGKGVYTVLDRMVGKKTVTQRASNSDGRSMVYALPTKRDTHPPSPSVGLLTKFSETTATKGETNSQQLVNTESTVSKRTLTENPVVDFCNPFTAGVSGDSQQKPTEDGGVCVLTKPNTEVDQSQLSHTHFFEAAPQQLTEVEVIAAQIAENAPPESDPTAFFPNNEPVFEGSVAVVVAEEVPQDLKGQIQWSMNIPLIYSRILALEVEAQREKEKQEWEEEDTLKDMAAELARCESLEVLHLLRDIWRNRKALNAASKLLSHDKRAQIKAWAIELSKSHPLFEVGNICTYSGKEYRFQKICKNHKLKIQAIANDVATVSCKQWSSSVSNEIPLVQLRLIG